MLMRSFFSTFEEISLFFRCRQIKTLISLFWEFWNHVRLSLLSLTNTVFSIFFPSLFFSDSLYIKKHLGSFRSRRVIMSSLNTKATDAEIVNGIKGSSILFITIWSIGMFFFWHYWSCIKYICVYTPFASLEPMCTVFSGISNYWFGRCPH